MKNNSHTSIYEFLHKSGDIRNPEIAEDQIENHVKAWPGVIRVIDMISKRIVWTENEGRVNKEIPFVEHRDSQDARRYRFLRETSFRSKTPKGAWIEVHYAAKQNPNWPMTHAFEDLDRAIDEEMERSAK